MNNELGILLKNLRGYRSLRTVSELTDGKVSYSYLNILEKGINPTTGLPVKPNPEILKILSNVYNYSYDEFMKIAGYIQVKAEDKVEKAYKEFKSWSIEEQDKFLKMLNIK